MLAAYDVVGSLGLERHVGRQLVEELVGRRDERKARSRRLLLLTTRRSTRTRVQPQCTSTQWERRSEWKRLWQTPVARVRRVRPLAQLVGLRRDYSQGPDRLLEVTVVAQRLSPRRRVALVARRLEEHLRETRRGTVLTMAAGARVPVGRSLRQDGVVVASAV